MFIIDYDFQPGDEVFVVIGTRIEAGVVLNVNFKVYDDSEDVLQEDVTYRVLLDDALEGTVDLDSAFIFATLQEAADFLESFITPTPTPSPTDVTETPTPTPTVTPTVTASLTPSTTATPTITPTNTVTPTVTTNPTATPTVTATVTPTVSVTPTDVTNTPTPTPSPTPNVTPTPTVTSNPTPTPTVTATITPSATVTPSATASVTPTVTPTSTVTPTITPTNTVTPTVTASPTVTPTTTVTPSTTPPLEQFLFILNGDGPTDSDISEHTVSTTDTLSSASFTGFRLEQITQEERQPVGLHVNNAGTDLYYLDDETETVYQVDLSSPWDLSSAVYNNKFFDLQLGIFAPRLRGITFSVDGSQMFILDNDSRRAVKSFTLSVPFDITTATYDGTAESVRPERDPTAITFSSSGDKYYIVGNDRLAVQQFDLAVPYDITTKLSGNNRSSETLELVYGSESINGLSFNSDGTKLFVYNDGSAISTYDLLTPWSVSTGIFAGLSGVYVVEGSVSRPTSFIIRPVP